MLASAVVAAIATPTAAITGPVVEVRARGNQGTETVELHINGQPVASWPLTTTYQTFTHPTPADTDILTVRVGHHSGPWPNAVIVDHITVDGIIHQSEGPTTRSQGSWDPIHRCGPGYKQSEWLSCDGAYFAYDVRTEPSGPSERPIVILDSDLGPDIDDALALAMLHGYASEGLVEIGALTISRNSDMGARYADLVNTFYGRPDIPIGVFRGTTARDSADHSHSGPIVGSGLYPFDVDDGTIPEAYVVMRDVLAGVPDGGVVIIQIGFSTNTARLLEVHRDLVARKARLLSIMAGDNGDDRVEFNIGIDVPAAQSVFGSWPNQLV